jgi:hypothetical protein
LVVGGILVADGAEPDRLAKAGRRTRAVNRHGRVQGNTLGGSGGRECSGAHRHDRDQQDHERQRAEQDGADELQRRYPECARSLARNAGRASAGPPRSRNDGTPRMNTFAEGPRQGLQLRSLIKGSGELELSLVEQAVLEPGPDEVLIRVEGSPINPSDLGLLLGAADMATARASGTAERPVVTATVPERHMPAMAARLDESMPVGNEGAGTVVEAGASAEAQSLLGRTVAVLGAPCTPSTVSRARRTASSCRKARRLRKEPPAS